MNTSTPAFKLVGVRFSKIVVDERAIAFEGGKDLRVVIMRSKPKVSDHKLAEKSVIEMSVSVVAAMHEAPLEVALDQVFHLECTAGFIPDDMVHDGNLDAFSGSVDQFARSLYWVVRERLDSVFAITTLRGIQMPWDLVPEEAQEKEEVGPPPAGSNGDPG